MPSCLVALLRGNAALVAVMADSSLVFIFEQTKRESGDAAGVSAIGNLCGGTCCGRAVRSDCPLIETKETHCIRARRNELPSSHAFAPSEFLDKKGIDITVR
jgi:hypothetical protein